MCKRRRLLQPKIPSSALEFETLLKESSYSAKHITTAIDQDEMAIIFGSKCMLNNIKDSPHIQFDGTFYVVPKIFLQLFTLFIQVNDHTLPALHILMTRKTEKLYIAAILAITELIPNFNPIFAIGDFELAPRKALEDIHPSITIIGCWFHFTKAIYERILKIGLSKLYKTNKTFKKWIRNLMAVPFLPEEEIRSTYFSLELPLLGLLDSAKELVKLFISYFNRTWINGNVNLSVFYYEKATNNGAESYHKCLKSYFKTPHSNIWKFMLTLNNVITDYDLELQRLLEGHETTRGSNSKTQCKTARRNDYKEKYLNNTFSALEFLDAITQTIGHGNLYSDATTIPVINDFFDVSVDEEEEINCDRCHVCLLPRTQNFALLHEQYVHGGFCEICASRLLQTQANCPICRDKIKVVLQIFQ